MKSDKKNVESQRIKEETEEEPREETEKGQAERWEENKGESTYHGMREERVSRVMRNSSREYGLFSDPDSLFSSSKISHHVNQFLFFHYFPKKKKKDTWYEILQDIHSYLNKMFTK